MCYFSRSIIQQVCVSDTHIVALTLEGLAYTWGEGKKGQLGHGELGQIFIKMRHLV